MMASIPEQLRVEVETWIEDDPDPKTRAELKALLAAGDLERLRSCFAGFLEFGTAGLRGPLGPGPSRMNRAVVSKTAAGLAAYMRSAGLKSIVIGRDARHGSAEFTTDTAEIMSGAGFNVFILPRPLPTPVLAFAVRALNCDVGVMVTASHNPPQDNGYKVYLGGRVTGIDYHGSQIIAPTDSEISTEIANAAPLRKTPRATKWQIVDEDLIDRYIQSTAKLAKNPTPLRIVYTAMHGVGKEVLLKVFAAAGFENPILVEAQAEPDPDFPTVAFPNPEEPGAMDLALARAAEVDAELVIANDPDADRCAAAIKDRNGKYRMLRGDEVGILLGEYLAQQPGSDRMVLANSIVSSSALSKIAAHYGLPFTETLTGFKYLAKVESLRFGYEEALGYAVDPGNVNDKDGISAALLLAQLAADLKRAGRNLQDLLDEIWSRHGFHATRQISVRTNALQDIDSVMTRLRTALPNKIGEFAVTGVDDLAKPGDGLPPTNGLRIWLDGKHRVIVRPSGTEPKVKCYLEVIAPTETSAQPIITAIELQFRTLMEVT